MKQKVIIAASFILLLTGCGANTNHPATEVPIQEQIVVQKSSEIPLKSEEELTAELEEKRASLSEEEFIAYMNTERKAELHLPESAVYNPDLEEYYDSSVKEWNAECHDYIRLEQTVSPESKPVVFPYEGEIPAKMQKELEIFWAAVEKRFNEDEGLVARSDWVFLDDTEYLHTLETNTTIQYFDTWAEMSKCWGDGNTVLAIHIVKNVLNPHNTYTTAEFADQMKEQLTLASGAVNALGDSISAEDVTALQETYGYTIAPALQDIGKLDLLQIDPDSPCQDAEKLAEFARYFA